MDFLYNINYSVVEFKGATKETMQRVQNFLDQTKAIPVTLTSYISSPISGPAILTLVLIIKIKTRKYLFKKS